MNERDLRTEESVIDTISDLMGNLLYEINDNQTRLFLGGYVDRFLSSLISDRRIYQFRFVSDETNNTPEIIDSHNIILEVWIKYSNIHKTNRYYKFDYSERNMNPKELLNKMEEVNG